MKYSRETPDNAKSVRGGSFVTKWMSELEKVGVDNYFVSFVVGW